MESVLTEKLRNYIATNNPDLLLALQDNYAMTQYVEDKVSAVLPLADSLESEGKPLYIIEEACLKEMTTDLRPSKFQYVKSVLETEFESDFERLRESGVLTYEITNMIPACKKVFDVLNFSEANEDDRMIHNAVTGCIAAYLEGQME